MTVLTKYSSKFLFWSVICVLPVVKCGHPAVPVNARVSLTNPDLAPGTAATYTCDEGYELFGWVAANIPDLKFTSVLQCLSDRSKQKSLTKKDSMTLKLLCVIRTGKINDAYETESALGSTHNEARKNYKLITTQYNYLLACTENPC
jgi:hypothetical protein